ncbi:MAG TPA: Gfo/Idh/MocA family oxidoreductase [Jiangellales bacterium]|nr:Gfo/Idh/MocA family oxidoreductase [Jiangellales bacterium]
MAGSLEPHVRVGLVGAGRIGSFHGETVALHVPGARLSAVADPAPGAAERLADRFGARAYTDPAEMFASDEVDAVLIASTARAHTDLVVAAAAAGKPIFCEKPMAFSLEDADRAIAAAAAAGVPLQVGFNRRFAADFRAAHEVVTSGGIGTPHLLRSLTRDPGLANPGGVPPWTIFRETLIHDFDALLWFAGDACPVEVYAVADALVAPDFRDAGLLDTSVVLVRFDSGAIAAAEASFSAAYGYDVRGEVFGSAGMVTAGEQVATAMRHYSTAGVAQHTVRADTALFRDAYTAELAHFVDCARTGASPEVTGHDARAALAVAVAAIASVSEHRPVALAEVDPA